MKLKPHTIRGVDEIINAIHENSSLSWQELTEIVSDQMSQFRSNDWLLSDDDIQKKLYLRAVEECGFILKFINHSHHPNLFTLDEKRKLRPQPKINRKTFEHLLDLLKNSENHFP